MSLPTLISHHLCPYVQRAVISLTEKRANFERITIDLSNKPEWFIQLSPLGKVPLLKVNGRVIFESAVILEYLEDTLQPPLHPTDPFSRAQHRAWIEFGSTILNDIGGFYSAPDVNTLTQKGEMLRSKFIRLDEVLADGPYFAGPNFSLVDAVFGPIFRYFDTFDLIHDFGILTDLRKVKLWRQALAARPSVQNAVAPDYPERLKEFLKNKGSALSSLI